MSEHRLPKAPRALRELLEARGLRLAKERGQNFLVDKNVLAGIAADADTQKGELILEVGPGAGALTEYLLEEAGLVVAVDVDRGLIELLSDFLGECENLQLCLADVMGKHNQLNASLVAMLNSILAGAEIAEEYPDLNITKLGRCRAEGWPELRVVANLPYSITSPVIIALLESALPIKDLTLLVQREVADKICAPVGQGDWGLLSLLVRLHGEAEMLRKVPRTVFWPMPKVDSAVIRITPNQARDHAEISALKACVAPIFRYRRKSLSAGLKHAHGLKAEASAALLAAAGLVASDHVEKLEISALQRLSAAFEQNKPTQKHSG